MAYDPNSILQSIKVQLSGETLLESADLDASIIIFINAAIAKAAQMGIGPVNGYTVTNFTDKWTDWLGDEPINLGLIKNYIFYDVKLSFDPPQSSALLNSYKELLKEAEVRMFYEKEYS